MKAARVLLALVLLAFAGAAGVRAGDETCYPIPVTWYSPSGLAGCSLDGPTAGIASWYSGTSAAANWCTYPWRDCGWVTVQSHQTGVTITVEVKSFCDCYWPTADRRLIDLTRGQVLALGLDPAAGLFDVTVTPASADGSSGDSVVPSGPVLAPLLPDTAMAPR